MCNECWKEFKGWLRSFTRTECALAALQLVLLIVFIAFLTFLILHFMACSVVKHFYDVQVTKTTQQPNTVSSQSNMTLTTKLMSSPNHTTLSPDIECTWKPSRKTDAVIQYYESGQTSTSATTNNGRISISEKSEHDNVDNEQLDGKIADVVKKAYLLALGKVNIPQDVTFGCVLTIISEYCTLTAASCIESIEEVDTVDAFVIIEGYGDRYMGRIHTVSDVVIHPEYQGINKEYDVAVLKSEDSLIKYGQSIVRLPSMLDALMITIGEEFSLLGYGRFRRPEDERRRVVRELAVRTLASVQCAGPWALRHLAHGAALGAGSCGAPQLCAGPLRAPSTCSHCAGVPLLRGPLLLAVMAAAPCGDACGPALYVNVATVVDWLHATIAVE